VYLFQELKAVVDGRRSALSEALRESQKAIDGVKQSRDPATQQLAQKLRCNTSNVRISFDRVRSVFLLTKSLTH